METTLLITIACMALLTGIATVVVLMEMISNRKNKARQ